MTSLKSFLNESELTFNSINSTNFFLSVEKTLKEYTAKIILHYLKKSRNDIF
ncbi:MAG: hypothetical protein K2X95_10655 [Flavobacteriaceae bacterium]|nr:hypothetical protein [Flavobacteriaceae bacterium]